MFEVTERRRLSDVIANRIREHILEHDLRPGDRLPTENEMAMQFGVSRVSIREATKALGFLGMLESTPRRGTIVGQVNLGRVSQFLEFHPALRDATAQQLIDSRTILEIGTLPHVIRRMAQNPEIYRQLNELVAGFSTAEDLEEWIDLDRQFHSQLIEASGVTPLLMFLELLQVFFNRIFHNIQKQGILEEFRTQLPAGAASHQRIIDFLRDGDLAQAERELRVHISSQRANLVNETGRFSC